VRTATSCQILLSSFPLNLYSFHRRVLIASEYRFDYPKFLDQYLLSPRMVLIAALIGAALETSEMHRPSRNALVRRDNSHDDHLDSQHGTIICSHGFAPGLCRLTRYLFRNLTRSDRRASIPRSSKICRLSKRTFGESLR
jgi:hypothetical protein